jgi:hypothetical protein
LLVCCADGCAVLCCAVACAEISTGISIGSITLRPTVWTGSIDLLPGADATFPSALVTGAATISCFTGSSLSGSIRFGIQTTLTLQQICRVATNLNVVGPGGSLSATTLSLSNANVVFQEVHVLPSLTLTGGGSVYCRNCTMDLQTGTQFGGTFCNKRQTSPPPPPSPLRSSSPLSTPRSPLPELYVCVWLCG